MKISEAQTYAKKLAQEFDAKYNRTSTLSFYFVDMIQEMGKLAEIVRAEEFYRTKSKGNLENQLVDVLYDILMISNMLNVDLEKAFVNRMHQFRRKFLQSASC